MSCDLFLFVCCLSMRTTMWTIEKESDKLQYATHPTGAYPKYLKNTTDNHDKSINRFIERWELEKLLFPLKPADHMYVCTLLDHRIWLFFKLKFLFRSSVTFKVHSDLRGHLPPHEMSCLDCKAQKGHRSCCIGTNYRPQVYFTAFCFISLSR